MAGHGAAGLQLAVHGAAGTAVFWPGVAGLSVCFNAGGVGAAVAGRGVAGQTLMLRAASAAPAGTGPLFQLVHVKVQGVADVGFPVLLLLCVGKRSSAACSVKAEGMRVPA